MSRWSARFRRAAAALACVHLLQVILLAASAVCDRALGDTTHHAPATATVASVSAASADAHAAHHVAHIESRTESPTESHATPHTPQPAPHHTSHTTNCPMAMACASPAIVVPVPTLTSTEVRVSTARIIHDDVMLRSLRAAPEPPPPRG
jgi:hypothetical protein